MSIFEITDCKITDYKVCTQVEHYVSQKAIPRLSIFLQGVSQNRPEEPPKPTGATRRLALRLNGRVQAVIPFNTPEVSLESDKDLDDFDDSDLTILDQVDKSINDNAQDAEDGPDWMFEDGEKTSPDPDYVFCPAPHRKQILHLFTKHFCQHPVFPERRGTGDSACLTGSEIRRIAVSEMYQFCHARGLREVWGYLWACWYTPKMWRLWARSTSSYISRLRTTMGVENFWRQLKHNYLHNVARPRLDHLVWILIYKVTPAYYAQTDILNDTHRMGRSKPLTTYQRAFKKAWIALSKRPLGTQEYKTDVSKWMCNCGSQMYHCHHLCKHLVQAVPSVEMRFFRTIVRRRTSPIYRHPFLVTKNPDGDTTTTGAYLEPDGSITDGDDNVWSGNTRILEGGGGWEALVTKRMADQLDSDSDTDSGTSRKRVRLSGKNKHMEDSPPPTTTSSNDVIDLTMSSPAPESDPADDTSSTFEYGFGNEDEVCIFPGDSNGFYQLLISTHQHR